MVPIPRLDTNLEAMLSQEPHSSCAKCAYVIPTYEISYLVDQAPRNKTELLQLVQVRAGSAWFAITREMLYKVEGN